MSETEGTLKICPHCGKFLPDWATFDGTSIPVEEHRNGNLTWGPDRTTVTRLPRDQRSFNGLDKFHRSSFQGVRLVSHWSICP